jgi:inner membrane protein
MDPIAHSLVGAGLAELGLKRATRYATTTLVIGANLPDIDVVTHAWGEDAMLLHRRGWTHGVLAMIVLPILLTACVVGWHHLRAREGPAPRVGWLLALSAVAIASHPFLDWLNTYGVRLLMPFDGRWFYGDALFILDAWLWLLPGAAVFLARSASRRALVAWGVLAAVTSVPTLLGPGVTLAVKASWIVGLGALVLLRWSHFERTERLARVLFAIVVAHIGTALALTAQARGVAAAYFRERGLAVEQLAVIPQPGAPLRREVVGVTADAYHFVAVSPFAPPLEAEPPLARGPMDATVEAALDEVPGYANWLRLPAVTVNPDTVIVRDVRYDRGGPPRGIGRADIPL